MKRDALAAVIVAACGACTPGIYRAPVRQPNYYSVGPDGARSSQYSQINEWVTYGTDGLGAQARVAAAYEDAQHAPAPPVEIVVYNASLPPGVSIDDGTFAIAPDAPYEAVGRFELGYWLATAPRETAITDDLRRLAAVAGADTFIVEIRHVGHADDRVNYVSGVALRQRSVTRSPPSVAARRAARLEYRARGSGCLSPDEFADEVSVTLGYSPWREDAAPTLTVEVQPRDTDFLATITVPGARPKQLTGTSCRSVTAAVVAVVAVQLDEPRQR